MTTIEQVKQFHDAFGVPTPACPDITQGIVNDLRIDLLREELKELEDAIEAIDEVAVLDALTDLQYVLDGAYLALGFSKYKDAAFAEVQASNMSKLGEDGKPICREDGKILKGANYFKPNLQKILKNK